MCIKEVAVCHKTSSSLLALCSLHLCEINLIGLPRNRDNVLLLTCLRFFSHSRWCNDEYQKGNSSSFSYRTGRGCSTGSSVAESMVLTTSLSIRSAKTVDSGHSCWRMCARSSWKKSVYAMYGLGTAGFSAFFLPCLDVDILISCWWRFWRIPL